MNETNIGLLASAGVASLAVVCLLYMLGGRSGKWKRRFVASFIAALSVNLILVFRGLWSPWFIAIFPLLSIGFHLGYGADITIKKIFKRLIYTLAISLSGLIFCIKFGGNAWMVLPVHVGVGLWSIWLGVKNPLEAAAEEVFVCLLLLAGLYMYPFITGVNL